VPGYSKIEKKQRFHKRNVTRGVVEIFQNVDGKPSFGIKE
jgi:hypothetical protein